MGTVVSPRISPRTRRSGCGRCNEVPKPGFMNPPESYQWLRSQNALAPD
jgi:hypothetical protein